MENNAYRTSRDEICQKLFLSEGPFWHLVTSEKMPVILRDDCEFAVGMNLFASSCSLYPGLKVLAFTWMNNHLHAVIGGDYDAVLSLFETLRRRLVDVFSKKGGHVGLSAWACKVIGVSDLGYMRNLIAYVHRNGYVVDKAVTPFSYVWGTGHVYYNAPRTGVQHRLHDLPVRIKREIFRSRDVFGPDEWIVVDDRYIAPESFCDVGLGMAMFRNAHQYLSALTKNVEAYSQIALELMEDNFATDNELYSVVARLCKQDFGVNTVRDMDQGSKVQLVRKLHYDYRAGNSQISRITALPQSFVDSLFPLSSG